MLNDEFSEDEPSDPAYLRDDLPHEEKFRAFFGFSPPKWEPESLAPEIDDEMREEMLRLARGEMTPTDAARMEAEFLRFRSVYAAFLEIDRRESRKRLADRN